jgi:putative glutathione S-transferase
MIFTKLSSTTSYFQFFSPFRKMSSFAGKVRDALAEVSNEGKFVRTASGYREMISRDHPKYQPEAGRYHLYISYACPWANRCFAMLKLKGLTDVISVTVTHPTWQKTKPNDVEDKHFGWAMYDSKSGEAKKNPNGFGSFVVDGCEPDPVNNAQFVRDLYELNNDTFKKYSVPVLWDKKTSTIVNNESSEIIRMLNSAFNEFVPSGVNKYAAHDFMPETFTKEINEMNDFVYNNINDGVYRSGFAKSQAAYEEAVNNLFQALDKIETTILSKQRYLIGNFLTECDLRLFMTLIRFDEVYVVYFKCNIKMLKHDYPNIHNYMRELYQIPEIQESIRMDHIKTHYYT